MVVGKGGDLTAAFCLGIIPDMLETDLVLSLQHCSNLGSEALHLSQSNKVQVVECPLCTMFISVRQAPLNCCKA